MSELLTSIYFLPCFCIGFFVLKLIQSWNNMYKLSKIPTAGPDNFFVSLFGSVHFVKHARDIIQEGYDKYHGRVFKVRTPDQWLVIVTGPVLLDDVRKTTDDQLSFAEALSDNLQIEYTLGRQQRLHRYHVNVIRNALTRNIQARFEEVRDEIVNAFDDNVPLSDDWTVIPAFSTVMQIVCRTSNRLFVGLPLCRDPDWINLNIQFTIDVMKAAQIIKLFPDFLKPIVGNILTPTNTGIHRTLGHLGPIIRDRLAKTENQFETEEDSGSRPNDLISWLLEENPGGEFRTVKDVALRVLNVNMAAIHTTSIEFTHILYHLAIQPPYIINALRDEVESAVAEYGWTKAAMPHLRKVDSFMKEVARMMGISVTSVNRKVLKELTLSDGTILPAGTLIAIPVFSLHQDKRNYEDPYIFKPFRFYEMRMNEGESIKHQMATPNSEYLFFGTGKHACPGRFFAVNELKTLLAHTLTTYDVKLEGDSKKIPEPFWFGPSVSPNQTAKVLFRKRKL
ncbi:hypothetical protein VKT23_014509 [Stygiomarasmius scandens]|uniref:Cytochrome P450 n=1 Tax=Marasmiellus scandens TaxID=2682957 RepID=A0ABR1J2J1_9AGAR